MGYGNYIDIQFLVYLNIKRKQFEVVAAGAVEEWNGAALVSQATCSPNSMDVIVRL